jgi:hypothetical protein
MDQIELTQERDGVADSECGDELLGYIKCGEFLD